MEGLQVLCDWLSQSSQWGTLVMCSKTGTWLGVDLSAYYSQLWEFLGLMNLLDLTSFSVWWYSPVPHSSLIICILDGFKAASSTVQPHKLLQCACTSLTWEGPRKPGQQVKQLTLPSLGQQSSFLGSLTKAHESQQQVVIEKITPSLIIYLLLIGGWDVRGAH
jgi:hypothetical protein